MAMYWETELRNPYTGEVCYIRAKTQEKAEEKIQKKKASWDKKYQIELSKKKKEKAVSKAIKQTQEAQSQIHSYENILKNNIPSVPIFSLHHLYSKEKFPDFVKPEEPSKEKFFRDIPKKKLFTEFIFPFLKVERREKFKQADYNWHIRMLDYRTTLNHQIKNYQAEKKKFEEKGRKESEKINSFKVNFEKGSPKHIERYIDHVLKLLSIPDSLNINSESMYIKEEKAAVININYPKAEKLLNVKEYKYIQSKKEIVAKMMSKKDVNFLHENVIYQVAVSAIYNVFQCFYTDHLNCIIVNVFQGTSCIFSYKANKDIFEKKKITEGSCKNWLNGQPYFFNAFKAVNPISYASKAQYDKIAHYNVKTKKDISYNFEYAFSLLESSGLDSMSKKLKIADLKRFIYSDKFNSVLGVEGFETFLSKITEHIEDLNDEKYDSLKKNTLTEALYLSGIYYEDDYLPEKVLFLKKDERWKTSLRVLLKKVPEIGYFDLHKVLELITFQSSNYFNKDLTKNILCLAEDSEMIRKKDIENIFIYLNMISSSFQNEFVNFVKRQKQRKIFEQMKKAV